MKRRLILTEDGSHSLYVEDMDEPYHSIHGALQESKHVFIEAGLQSINSNEIRILELGFGTGLNALLTLSEGFKGNRNIHYHTVEKYPLAENEYGALNFEGEIPGCPEGSLEKLHCSEWEKSIEILPGFSLLKEEADFREFSPAGPYDLVYYDAFAPQKQPRLWSEDIFRKISGALNPGAILVTYTAMGSVRRALKACGFMVEKIPGPPGKREMVRAIFQ